MAVAKLRKVGGSVMVGLPPAVLQGLDLAAGQEVTLSIEEGRLIVAPPPRKRYTLDALLAEEAALEPLRDAMWLNDTPQGRELI